MRTKAEIAAAVLNKMHEDRKEHHEEANRSAAAWVFLWFNADEFNRLWAEEEAADNAANEKGRER